MANDRHFTDDNFKCIYTIEKCILIMILLKFIPRGPIDIKSVLARAMSWHRTGDRSISEPMMV